MMFAPFLVCLICALCVMSITPVNSQSSTNDWDGPVHLSCNDGYAIGSWSSHHDNYKEDRRYTFHCDVYVEQHRSCHWTDYVNDFDHQVNFKCGPNRLLAGIFSYHKDYYEDRRWKFRCCTTPIEASGCTWTGYLNDWDEPNAYHIPHNRVVKGVYSVHHDYYEDRRWKFYICRK